MIVCAGVQLYYVGTNYNALQKHESTLLHTYVLNDFLTADHSFTTNKDILKESKICGLIVLKGRERYPKNIFAHDLVMLKLSEIKWRLNNVKKATQMQNNALHMLSI